jgi:hypothetical protein
MRVEQFSEMGSLLREVAHENPNQIAWIRIIAGDRHNPPAEICESIVANVNTFVGSQAARDDQTLVIARLEPSEIERIPAADAEPVVKAQINTTWTPQQQMGLD